MRKAVTLFALARLAAPAFAGGSQDTAATPPANGSAIEQAIADDPAADRAFAGSTALTLPAGDATWSLRASLGPAGMTNVEYGATDRVQLGAGLGWIIDFRDYEKGVAPFISVKVRALSNGWGALGVELGMINAPGGGGLGRGWAPYGSAIASACIGPRCALMASGYVSALRTPHGSFGKELIPIYGGGSISYGQDHVKLFAEVDVSADYLEGGFADTIVGGVRLVFPSVAVDLGIAHIHLAPSDDDSGLDGETVVAGVTLR